MQKLILLIFITFMVCPSSYAANGKILDSLISYKKQGYIENDYRSFCSSYSISPCSSVMDTVDKYYHIFSSEDINYHNSRDLSERTWKIISGIKRSREYFNTYTHLMGMDFKIPSSNSLFDKKHSDKVHCARPTPRAERSIYLKYASFLRSYRKSGTPEEMYEKIKHDGSMVFFINYRYGAYDTTRAKALIQDFNKLNFGARQRVIYLSGYRMAFRKLESRVRGYAYPPSYKRPRGLSREARRAFPDTVRLGNLNYLRRIFMYDDLKTLINHLEENKRHEPNKSFPFKFDDLLEYLIRVEEQF